MKTIRTFLALVAALTAHAILAADAPANTNTTRYPFHGKLSAVNISANTFSVKGTQKDRIFKVTSQTKITKNGKSATLADAVVGEPVGGYVEKQPDKTLIALSVRFGPKTDETKGLEGTARKRRDNAEPAP